MGNLHVYPRVQAPADFVGYESAFLRVADPDAQTDSLKLRIYSSDGAPVAGGLPDLSLYPGENRVPFDLDDYYHDADDADERMSWQVTGHIQTRVAIDPATRFGGDEQTISLRSVQGDLKGTGVLIWSGSVRLSPGSSGTLAFRAAGLTRLETPTGTLTRRMTLVK